MPTRGWVALGFVALLCAPALAETTSHAERRVVGAVALPLDVLVHDAVAWRVDVPPGTFVQVHAEDANGTTFYLRANRTSSGLWFPGPAATLALAAPGAWRVEVDPVAGAPVDVRVAFRGFVADYGGIPASFTLSDLEPERGCITPGVCLP